MSPTSGLGISFIGSGVKLPGQAAVESEVVGSAGTIVEILRRRAEVRPSDSAFSYLPDGPAQARSLTYGELEARAHAIASHLVEEGFRGERVLLLYPVGLEFVEAFFGCLLAGVVAVPAPPPRGSRNLARLGAIAADAAARAALSPSSLLSRYLESSSSHPALNRLRWVATDLLAAGAPSRLADFSHPPESVAYLQYTSGSTSEPKGVMIQHANIMANSEEIRLGFRHSRESRSLSWLPHFHDMGLVDGILQPVYSGFPAVLMSPASFLQTPARWLEAIARHRITHSGGPNFAYDLCSRRIDPDPATLDLRTWAVAYNGAEPVRAETLERFAERFAPCGFRREAFYPAYGLAEATLKVSGGLPGNGPSVLHLSTMALEAGRAEEDPAGRRLVGSGPAGASTRAVVVEPETGLPLPENQVGEIWVSGPGVALGYWGRVEESERTFGARLPGERARFLRTGDLGFLRNGEIFVAGRRKDLIIIRGRNLYPQDVERTVEACDAALRPASGACFGVEVGGEERLVAVHEIDRGSAENGRQLIAAVRTAILETHEVDPLAIVLVGPAGVPKTSSGKVQRAACRKAFLEGSLPALAEWRAAEVGEEAGQETAPGAGPADPRGWLAARLASKLGVARASLDFDGSLARHGLDSLRSLELAHEIEQRFGAGLTVVDLLSADSLAQIVARIEAASPRSGAGAGVVEEESRECPLSAGQQALWFLHELAPESAAYTIAAALRLEGPLDEAALETAARALISRHPSLRGRIVSDDAGSRQRFDVQFESIFRTGNLDVPEPESLADQLGEEAYKPFDFANGPLFRMALLRAPDFPVLMVACHHGTADLWSLSLVLADLQALYAAALGLREAPPKSAPHPADFVRWQAGLMGGPAGVQQLEFWRERLAGDYPALDLPIDRPRPAAQTFAGGALTFPLPSNLTTALRGLARDRGVTLYTLLLAAYQVFLHRLTGQAEVRVGSPASGRTHPKFAELVACLVNTVVLRADFSGDPAFETFLGVAREEVLGAIQRQDYPFATLVKKLAPERDPSRSPLFDTLFDFHGAGDVVRGDLASAAGGARVELGGGLTAEPLTIRRRSAQFDLTTTVTDAGTELWVEFEYNSDLFEAATLDRFARHFTALLAGIASHPATRVSRLPLLAPAERAELLHDANARPVNAPFEPVHRRFEREALRHPGAAAAFHDGAGLTYGELNRRANALARRLRNLGVGPESRVAVCFAKSLELLVALMGVLKAGGAYVPIDPSLPAARRRFMASDSGAGVLLAPETLADDFDTEIEWVDLAKHANLGGEGLEDSDLQRDPSPENLAYLIYTSGTAGTPKAVGVTHANLSGAYGAWEIAYHLRSLRTHLQMASPGFDVFSGDLVRALCSGGSLLICDRDTLLDPPALAALARARRAEFAEFVPATLRELAGHLARTGERLDSLKVVAVGSDTWSMADYRLFRRAFGEGTRLVNSYGVTEATIDSTVDDVGEEHYGRPVPAIGRPLANTAVYVLDPQLEPVPAGVCGELCLGGPAVARGYVGRPDLTADRFRPDPHGEPGARLYLTGDAARRLADGRIEFIGRADSQVKIRGYRVELAEIEAVLKAHPLVRACAVVAHAHVTGSRLAGYVVLHEGGAEAVAALRAHLAERLPDYMVPPEVVVLDALPLSPNGKIDRRALPPPEWKPDTRHVDRTPATGTERDLAEIWKTVLGLDRVGPEDNFFQLGGDSILSLQIVARAREAGLRVTPRMLFEHPTLAGLAGAAERQVAGASVAAWTGEAPLLPMQEWFFAQEFAEPSHWNMAMALEAREPLDLDSARRAAAALLDHHDALRARFQRDGSSWRQRIVPPGQGEPDLPWVQAAADESLEEAVGRCARRLAGRLDITRTTAIGFGIAADESMTRTVLVLVAHHLVVDGVSWRLLVEDFERAYRQVRDGKPPDLPPRTAPAAVWATSLVETARAGRLAEDWDRWRRLEGIRPPALPWDRNDPAPLEASTAFVTVDFEEGETGELRRASAAHGGIENVLLAALACACSDWMGSRSFYVELEGHGRDLLPDLDVSRTVGWFTQTHPVLIEGVDAADFGATLEAVGSAMRAAPGGGFEAWRRVSSHPVARGLGKVPGPEISFNYLGRFQSTLEEGSLFRTLYEPSSPQRSPRARRTHGVEIDASIVGGRLSVRWSYSGSQFDAATLDRVAAGFRLALTEFVARAALPDGIEEMLPLTPMQEGMLFHHLREAGGDPYLSQISLTLTGDVDPVAMERAWRVAIDRHPALRAEFIWEGVESPIQRIRRQVTLPVALHEGSDDRLEAVMSEARARGFDVSQAPLARVDLVRTTPNRMVVVFTHHHLLLDGWSLPLVLGTVFDAYEALVSGGAVAPAGAPALRRYAAWLAASDLPAAERFFRETLAGFAMPTPLPDVGRPHLPAAGSGVVHLAGPADVGVRAGALGLTAGTVVQAAWALTLAACSGERDVLFGATSSGRPAGVEGIETLAGVFINTLPMRARIDPRSRARDWMRAFQLQGAEVRQREHAPLALVQRCAATAPNTPLFESVLVFENYPMDLAALGRRRGFEVTSVRLHEETNYPLTLVVEQGDRMRFRGIYRASRYDEAGVRLILERLSTAVEALLSHPGALLGDISVLPADERRCVLEAWNATRRDYPRDSSIVEVFEQVARERGGAVALASAGGQWTYGELRERALEVAAALRRRGVGAESRVALAMDRSPELIMAILGVLQAGGAYVPLDPESPLPRSARMLSDAGVSLIVTDGRVTAPRGAFETVLFDDLRLPREESLPPGPPPPGPDALAYVMFTSGSTGEPKGIEVTHRNVLRLVLGVEYARLGAGETLLQLAPVAFDASTFEIWGALLCGGSLAIAPSGVASASEIARLLERFSVTAVWLTSGLFHLVVDEEIAALARVSQVIAGGDVLNPAQVRRLLAAGCRRVVNGYGPTETTTFACCEVLSAGDEVGERVPIGRPVANSRAYVLDETMAPVPIGAPGELYVGGDGVSRGYAGRMDLTAARFVPDPFGGSGSRLYRTGDVVRWRAGGRLEFLGRRDGQVKVRGFRVEVGEVEKALARLPGVRAAAVAARSDGESTQLVGYLVPGDAGGEAGAWRDALEGLLPRYMIPSRFVVLDALPLKSNGKVDRHRLPAPDPIRDRSRPGRPLTAVEREVADLWRRILKVEAIGPDDDFFAAGGHSLHATRLLAALRRAFRVDLPMAAFYEEATVAGLARTLIAHQPEAGHVERAARALAKLRSMAGAPRRRPLEESRREVETL